MSEGTPLYGDRAPTIGQYVVIAGSALLDNERTLTGTSNQIVVTDNGAGSTVVLSTPQDIHTGATPTFGGIIIADGGTIGQAAGPLITFDDTNNYLEITGCRLGLGTATPEGQFEVSDLAVDVTTTYFGGRFNHVKTAGVTDTSDILYGLRVRMEFDQSGGVISDFNALDGAAIMTDGEVGQSGTLRHLRGNVFLARQDGGTVWGDVMAGRYNVDLNAGIAGRDVFGFDVVMLIDSGMTSIGRDIYGARIYLDADQDPVGTAYGLYINCLSNVDYGIYQAGAASDNYFAGDVGIGATPSGKLHVDQTSTTGAKPVLFLDQGDVSEQCIQLSSDGVDRDVHLFTVNVTGAPAMDWLETADIFSLNKGLDVSAGAISSATLTLSAAGPTDNLDVSGVNAVFINTADNNVTLGGTVGGVDGQVLYIAVHDATNNFTIENVEGTGNQDFYLHAGADETMTAEHGGWVFINMGGDHWHDASHAKHV